MSFQDEMSELGRKSQHYVFDQEQVECCADKLREAIQKGLKDRAAAEDFTWLGLIPKRGVMVEYPFEDAEPSAPQTPFVRWRAYGGVAGIVVRSSKEINAVLKALKQRCAQDDINIYKTSARKSNDTAFITLVRATYVMK